MARKMRDSGVEWIGEVPEGWEVNLIGTFYSQRSEKVSDRDYAPLSVTMKGVLPQLATVAKTDDGDNRKLVKKGDFAINSRSDRRGSCGISEYDGSVSLINTILMPRGEMDPRYYNWLFHTEAFADEFYKWGHGIVDDLWTTRWSEMKRIQIVAPPLPEQRAIADYLDGKCAAIDVAVDELKRGIEDCKAWKKAIIFEAVTGKANVLAASACAKATADKKSAKVAKRQMRDSGIPWIGEIPEGWEVKPLRRLGRLANGISKGGEYFGKGFPFVSYSDVYKNDAIPTQVKGLVEANDQERERYSVKRGDVFFTRTSETVDEIGIAAACLKDIQDSTFAGFLIRFRPMTDELLPEFSKYYFRNKLVSEYFAKELVMVTRASLGQELLKSLPVFIPPMKEQQAIADYLDEKCAAIDALVAEKEKLIVDLEAYKKSLIFELVTGKREVA